ncbi:MAG: helix-turn-helix domain-containing protein [Gammaproteobacteria bacterium]|nr:helix-turn-helix domain-containing protein [Gammaproteobacteria bacterium]
MNINTGVLKQLRISKSWSQEQLAEEAGLSLRTVQRIESEGVASLQSRKAIAEALEVAPSRLDTEADTVINQNTESRPKLEQRHTFNPASLSGYYLLTTFRLFSIGFLWMILASYIVGGVTFVLGSIFFWELTPFTALQSTGIGIISALMIVPIYLMFLWPYKHAMRMEIARPLTKESANFSNT